MSDKVVMENIEVLETYTTDRSATFDRHYQRSTKKPSSTGELAPNRSTSFLNDSPFRSCLLSQRHIEDLRDIAHGVEESCAGVHTCLLYTSDAADERSSVDLGG